MINKIVMLSLIHLYAFGAFNKVVVWGHKLHSHTHSYIHASFYKAFKYMGYDTYWLDNNDDISQFDFSNTLFLTEWQVDEKMPIKNDCWYAVHNLFASPRKGNYDAIKKQGHLIDFRTYSKDCRDMNIHKINDYVYFDIPKVTLFIPWATDLLPFEIDAIKQKMPYQRSNTIFYIGTISGGDGGNINQMRPFVTSCYEHNIPFRQIQGCSMEENVYYNQMSRIAPGIQGTWQLNSGYIACRTLKLVSYGCMGVTNSEAMYELFNKKIVYNPDTYALLEDALKRAETITLEEMFESMDLVKDNYTYLNLIDHILKAFDLIKI